MGFIKKSQTPLKNDVSFTVKLFSVGFRLLLKITEIYFQSSILLRLKKIAIKIPESATNGNLFLLSSFIETHC